MDKYVNSPPHKLASLLPHGKSHVMEVWREGEERREEYTGREGLVLQGGTLGHELYGSRILFTLVPVSNCPTNDSEEGIQSDARCSSLVRSLSQT